MGSTRVGTSEVSPGDGTDPDLLAAADSLRWSRPDLTAVLADHVLETAVADEDRERWLMAAGWAVHARSATGDGRIVASEVLDALARWGAAPLSGPAAHRLRVELAALAAAVGEAGTARALLAPVTADATAPELRADAYCALARSAAVDRTAEVADAVRQAEAAWSEVGGLRGDIGLATAALVAAATERGAGRPAAAVERAEDGLGRLDRGRGAVRSRTPSGYLAAALAAEWISALVDVGRIDAARAGCVPIEPRLRETTRPSRQVARLRLVVARTVATDPTADGVIAMLEKAASDAADSDAPDLEAVCCSALGAVHEKAGRWDAALESMRLGVAAELRDRHRGVQFLAALRAVAPGTSDTRSASDGAGGSAHASSDALGDSDAAPTESLPVLDRRNGTADPERVRAGLDVRAGSRHARHRDREDPQRVGPTPGGAKDRDGGVAPVPVVRERGAHRPEHLDEPEGADVRSWSEGPSDADPSSGEHPGRSDPTRPMDSPALLGPGGGSPIGDQLARSLRSASRAAAHEHTDRPPRSAAGPWSTGRWSAEPVSAPAPPGRKGNGMADRDDRPADRHDRPREQHERPADRDNQLGDRPDRPGTPPSDRPGDRLVDRGERSGDRYDWLDDRRHQPSDRPGQPGDGDRDDRPPDRDNLSADRHDRLGVWSDQPVDRHRPDDRPSDRQERPGDQHVRLESWDDQPPGSGQPGVRHDRPESRDDQPAGTDQPGVWPDRPASRDDQPAGTDQPGVRPDRPASPNDQSGGPDDREGRPGVRSGQAGVWPDRPASRDDQSGDRQERPGDRHPLDSRDDHPPGPGDRHDRLGVGSDRPGDRDDRPGDGHERTGDRGDRPGDRHERTGDRADRPGDPPAAADAAGAKAEGDSWLQAALAELDRVWGRPPDDLPAPSPDAQGCVVVIDLARAGRRFAGRRAAAVVRSVADRLTGRLPSGARLRHDDADALSVVLPGWHRSAATAWMHGTLPGLLEHFVAAENLPGTQVRAAVHDADGLVGAQLLQRLDLAPGRSEDSRPAAPSWTEPGAAEPPVAGGEPPLLEASVSATGMTVGPGSTSTGSGRHDAAGRTPFRLDGRQIRPGSGGRRHRRGSDGPSTSRPVGSAARSQVAPTPAPPPAARFVEPSTLPPGPTSDDVATDGLGLADLLAGALAAYRRI